MYLLLGILLQDATSTDDKSQQGTKPVFTTTHQAIMSNLNTHSPNLLVVRHAARNVLSVGAELWYIFGAEGWNVAQKGFDVC